MGYNKSLASVERMLVYLRQIARARLRGENLEWTTDNPVDLAHKLRQALYAAQHHKPYNHFGRLRSHIQFRVRKPDTVIGKWMDLDLLNEAMLEESEIVQEIKVDYEASLLDIIGEVSSQPLTLEQAYFPRAVLPTDEMKRLFDWATENDWAIINHEDAGLTLTKRPIDKEIAWRPEGEEEDAPREK